MQDHKAIARKRLATIRQLTAADRILRAELAERLENELFITLHQRCISGAGELAAAIADQVARNV